MSVLITLHWNFEKYYYQESDAQIPHFMPLGNIVDFIDTPKTKPTR